MFLRKKLTGVLTVLFTLIVSQVWADVEQLKVYKQAFPDSKPKCVSCHLDEKPKKDKGKHELNEYGKKVMAELKTEKGKPKAENYKTVGTIESNKAAKKK